MSTILALHDPQTARAYYAEGLWQEDTLYSLARGHAAARPAAYALYYLVMSEFPMTASGKTLKRELVAWAREGRVQPAPCRCGGADRMERKEPI